MEIPDWLDPTEINTGSSIDLETTTHPAIKKPGGYKGEWFAYQYRDSRDWRIKPFLEQVDIDEVMASPFACRVVGPYRAVDREDARLVLEAMLKAEAREATRMRSEAVPSGMCERCMQHEYCVAFGCQKNNSEE